MRSWIQKFAYLLNRREKRMAVLLFIAMVFGALLEVAGVGAIPAFVALLSGPDRILRYGAVRHAFAAVGATEPAQRVLCAAVALAVLFAIKNGFMAIMAYAQGRYIYNRQVALGTRLFRAYLHAPYVFHLQRNSAQLLHNVENEVARIAGEVYLSALRIATEIMVLIAILGLLIAIEPVISIGMVLLLALSSAGFLSLIRRRITKFGTEEHHWRTKMIQAVHQGLGGFKDVKVLGREDYFLHSFARNAAEFTRAGAYKATVFELPRLILEVIAVIAMLGVAAIFIHQRRPMEAIVPVLTLLALAAVRLLPSANRVVNSVVMLRWGRPALDLVYTDLQALDRELARQKTATNALPVVFGNAIEFRHVRLRYPGASTESLKDVSFAIPRGSAVAFVGPSGSGKTTCADILLGLLEPTAGQVCVDGRDIRENLAGWQRLIGYIPQHIYLTDDSVRRNVAFGLADEEIDEAKVWAAIDAAQLRELIESLPLGLDTPVGERGVRLSGGQRQRIGIARALYPDPAVLVMDEATSALDNRTESLVMETLERLRGTRTIVAIAHRHTTVKRFDTVLLVRDGVLAAQGGYHEVLATSA